MHFRVVKRALLPKKNTKTNLRSSLVRKTLNINADIYNTLCLIVKMFRDGELKAIVERQKLKARYSFLRKTGNRGQ